MGFLVSLRQEACVSSAANCSPSILATTCSAYSLAVLSKFPSASNSLHYALHGSFCPEI